MTADIEYYSRSINLSRSGRRASNAISHQHLVAEIRIAAVDADTDVLLTKVENYTLATANGMAAVHRLARLRQNMEQLTPEVSGSLAFLAENHLMGVAELLHDYQRTLRRR